MNLQYNYLQPEKLEFNSEENGKMTVSGYASVFDNIVSYGYAFEKGAFADSLKNGQPIRFLFNHNADEVIGKVLECYEDGKGLFFKAEFNAKIQRAAEVYSMLKNGDINGVSIGFVTVSEALKNGISYKTAVDLWEISIVTFPANDKALIQQVNAAKSSKPALTETDFVALRQSVQHLSNSFNEFMKNFC